MGGEPYDPAHGPAAQAARHQQVQPRVWTDVRANQLLVENAYVDESGVLRSTGDDSVVAWHLKGCTRKGLKPSQLRYDEKNAPWCPECFRNKKKMEKRAARKGGLS